MGSEMCIRDSLLGQHTDEILSEVLNMDSIEISKLHDDKVIAGPEVN